MSLIDNSNGNHGDDTSSEERFSLLEFDTAPVKRYCTFSGCNDAAVAGELCAKHGKKLVTAVVRNVEMLAEARASSAQAHADEEAEAEAFEAEIAAEHAAATAQPVRAALTPDGCEIWAAFWFGQNPVFARTYTDGELLLVAGIDRAEMVYKAQPGAKVYQCNPGRLRKREAPPVLRTFQVPAEPVTPQPVTVAPAKAAPRVTPPAPIATRQPLVPAPAVTTEAQTQTGGTLEGALAAISTAHRPPPGLVNGYILPEDVNPVAGYYEPVIAKKGEATRYQDDRLHAAAQISADAVRALKAELGMTVRAPQVTHRATPRAVDESVPAPLREGINAARARANPADAAKTKAAKERAEKAAAELRARVTLDTAITIALQNTTGEYPHGCLAAWHSTGDVRWSRVAAAAQVAGVAPPKERSVRAIASDAVKAIQDRGLKVAVVKRGSAWSVYRPAAEAEVGTSVGEARLVATLEGEDLKLEGPEDLCATVRAAFKRAQEEAILGSTEVSAWLAALLSSLRAVSVVYGRWLAPGIPTETWRRLAEALNKAGLPVPARPAAISGREDIREEIKTGIVHEVETEVRRMQEARERGNYGARAADTAMTDLDALRDKAVMFTAITGPDALAPALGEIAALRAELEAFLAKQDDTTARGSQLDMSR